VTEESPMSAEDFTLSLVPNHGDMRRAGAWLAAQQTLEPIAMMVIYQEAKRLGRLFQLCGAMGETLVHELNLREDPEAMVQLRQTIATHALQCP
jgi:hypothetical protein